MSAAAEFPFDLAEITRAARAIRSYGVELDDLVSETAVGLMQRARSRPEEARRHPARMMRWAAQDALRRLTGSRRAARLEVLHLGEWELAATEPEGPDADAETADQLEEWRALSTPERLARIAEADAALGSSPQVAVRPVATGGRWGWNANARARRAAMVSRPRPERRCEGCSAQLPAAKPRQSRYCSARCRERSRVRIRRRASV